MTETKTALFLLPDPTQPGLTDAERAALKIRNAATVTGRCACGAVVALTTAGHYGIEHKPDCPAASVESLGLRLGKDMKFTPVIAEVAP